MAENIINKIWDTDAMADYSQEVYGPEGVAYNSPNTFQYHIDANDAAAAVPSNIIKGAIPGFGGETLGLLSDVAMPALALGSSPFYDAYQGITRVNDQFKGAPPGYAPTFSDYAKGVWDEDIGKSMIGRTLGAGQNLVRNAKDYGTGIMEALNPSKQTVIDRINAANNLSPMGTDVIGMDEMNTYGQVPMGTDVIGMDEMNTYGNRDFTNVGGLGIANEPDVEQVEYLGNPTKFQNFKSKMGEGINSLKNKASSGWDLAQKLPGMAMGALGGMPGVAMNLLSKLGKPDTPYQKFQKQMFEDMGWQGESNKDPWGKNINSAFGDYDVTEQWGDLMGSKLGDNYGYADAFADGVLDQNELDKMKAAGLKGWQLNRAIGLSTAAQKAKAWKDKKAQEKILTNQMTNTGGGGYKPGDATTNWNPNIKGTTSFHPSQGNKKSSSGSKKSSSGGYQQKQGSHHFIRGGRVGYGNGGLATLFTRRG